MTPAASSARRLRTDEARRAERDETCPGAAPTQLRPGHAEQPDMPATLRLHEDKLGVDPGATLSLTGCEPPAPAFNPVIPLWRERLFAATTSNAIGAACCLLIPFERVIELGTQVEL